MPAWRLEDPLRGFRDRLIIVKPLQQQQPAVPPSGQESRYVETLALNAASGCLDDTLLMLVIC